MISLDSMKLASPWCLILVVLIASSCGQDPEGADPPIVINPDIDAGNEAPDADAPDAGFGSDGFDGGPDDDCVAPQELCGGSCVNTNTDARNCGECAEMCGADELCVAGTCERQPDDCSVDGCPAGHYCDQDGSCTLGCSDSTDCPNGSCDLDSRACVCAERQMGLIPAVTLAGPPRAIAAADFDQDGIVDIVTSGYARDEAEFLAGKGDGTFATPYALGFGNYPNDLETIDVGGDGIPDLVLANSTAEPQQLRVIVNAGQAAFTTQSVVSTPTRIEEISVADLNGDGLDDFVGLHSYQRKLIEFIQQPDGSFDATEHELANARPESVAIADMDGDGTADFVVGDGTISQSRLRVYWGGANGPVEGPFFDVIGSPRVTVGDINGDGTLDIATVNTNGSVHLTYGAGGRQFGDLVEIHDAGAGGDIEVVDVTGDGLDDIIVSQGRWFDSEGDAIDVLVSAASETFAVQRLTAGASPLELELADLNSDGVLDLIVGNFVSRTLSVLPADGAGSFEATRTIATEDPYIGAERPVLRDLDADGVDDLIVLLENSVSVFYSSEGFANEANYTGGFLPDRVVVADFSGDGNLDLVVGTHQLDDITLHRGYPDGTFGAGEDFSVGTDAYGLAVVDVDADGNLDIVTAGSSASDITVGFGDGMGGVRDTVTIPSQASGSYSNVIPGDYDGDGNIDIAVGYGPYRSSDAVAVYWGDGTGAFSEQLLQLDEDAAVAGLGAVDLDADGSDELFVSVGEGAGAGDPYVALLDPDAVSPLVVRHAVDFAPDDIVAADSDGDGHVDVFATWRGRVLRFAGSGAVDLPQPQIMAIGGNRLAFGKLNTDDAADLAFVRHGRPWVGIAWGVACP